MTSRTLENVSFYLVVQFCCVDNNFSDISFQNTVNPELNFPRYGVSNTFQPLIYGPDNETICCLSPLVDPCLDPRSSTKNQISA